MVTSVSGIVLGGGKGAPELCSSKERVINAILKESKGLRAEEQAMLLAIARAESGFNPKAQNPKSSAAGVFQLIRATREALGVKESHKYDLSENVRGGVALYKELSRTAQSAHPRELYSERMERIYAMYHDGLRITEEGRELARATVLPYLPEFLKMVKEYRQNVKGNFQHC